MKAAVRLEHQILSIESEHDVHAMVELTVPDAIGAAARPPLRLALVLDRSGSMDGPKLAVAKRCAAWLAERLRPEDELALVSFDDEVRLHAPLAPVNGGMRGAIASLRPGGSTNLSGGWLKGLEQLRPAPADGVRKILLLTDGHRQRRHQRRRRALAARGDGRGRAHRHDHDRDRLRLRRGAPDAHGRRGRRQRALRRDG